MTERLRDWEFELYAVALVLSVAVVEGLRLIEPFDDGTAYACVAAGMVVSTALSRKAPGASLAVVWVVSAFAVFVGLQVSLVQLAVAFTAFGTARWGNPVVVFASGLSVPAAGVIGALYLNLSDSPTRLRTLIEIIGYDRAARIGDLSWLLLIGLAGVVLLAVPWLAGLAVRFRDRAAESQESQRAAEIEAAQSREIARLREDQARLARDVHDVVGHSLAVILAQAESAQYLEDADPQKLKETMANIATSARASLQDVRQVLTPTIAADAQPGSLDALISGVRDSGHEVVASEVGTRQPLPPELDVVAYRVLQEMLTNAIKHGRRGEPVFVERHWEGELRIEVRNVVGPGATNGDGPGQGLAGMRRRLEAVGGHFDVRRRDEAGVPTFTATAWVPVRSR